MPARFLIAMPTCCRRCPVHRLGGVILIVAALWATPAGAQAGSGNLRLVHADSARAVVEQGQSVIEALGQVRFVQDSADLVCDRARIYQGESRAEFIGNVMVREGRKWLRADRLVSHQTRRVREATGQVALGDGINELTARKVTYFEANELAIAEQEVALTNSDHRVLLTCERLEYDLAQVHALATESPVLVEFDSLQQELLRVHGDRIEMWDRGARVKISGNVVITREKTRSRCGEAEYFRTDERLELRLEPVVWQERDELRGDKIELFLSQQKLVRAHVAGRAEMKSPVDTLDAAGERLNSLSGGEMTLYFKDEEMEKVVVEETATSVYHLVEEGKDKGLNRVQGDRIILHLAGRELQRVIIVSKPGLSTGKYQPAGP